MMTSTPKVLIIGATGKTGISVANRCYKAVSRFELLFTGRIIAPSTYTLRGRKPLSEMFMI
ncbi:hypothetical protein C2W62_30505 [Candidatus Entotheonella serta]|nr:hypothetical protein C2W62_30505 [Candidatus Entotheonella serta]